MAAGDVELNRIDSNLANLPSSAIPAGYSFNISLNYCNGDSAVISGATHTLFDHAGNPLGTTTITIVGNSLPSNGQPATLANLAPLAAFQVVVGGDYGGAFATPTSGAGTVTYSASVGLVAQATRQASRPATAKGRKTPTCSGAGCHNRGPFPCRTTARRFCSYWRCPPAGLWWSPPRRNAKGACYPPSDDNGLARRVALAAG